MTEFDLSSKNIPADTGGPANDTEKMRRQSIPTNPVLAVFSGDVASLRVDSHFSDITGRKVLQSGQFGNLGYSAS